LSQKFKLGVVLSVTTGYLLCEIGDLYEILDYLTGQQLYTHQLPRAARYAGPHILKSFMELKPVVPEISSEKEVNDFLDELMALGYKQEYELEPMTDFVPKGPLEELIEMRNGSSEGIVVAIPE